LLLVDFLLKKFDNDYMDEEVVQKKDSNEGFSNPQVIYYWEAPLRPFVKRSRDVIRFYIALTLLVSLIVIFFGDKILLIPLWALVFIFYVFTVTPPTNIINKVTRFGIETVGTSLRWEILDHFFFTSRFGYDILTVVTNPPYEYHAYLVIPNQDVKNKVIKLLSKHIVYQEEPKKTTTDKLVDWLSKLVPQEKEENRERNHTPFVIPNE
jgi:hypothetical protein